MLQAAKHVDGRVLWANLHLLFWLSLMPFVTGWIGGGIHFAPIPVALYGFDLVMCGVAYYILARTRSTTNGANSPIAKALGRDVKGKASVTIYLVAIAVILHLRADFDGALCGGCDHVVHS